MAALHTNYLPPRDDEIDFVYCDDFLLVVNKPCGLLSVPGRGADKADNLTARVQKAFPDALNVHRLDMSTSGLLVIARGKEMHRCLSRMFRERMVRKSYLAVVAGRVKSAGAIDLPLGPDWPNRPRQKIDFAKGKNSLTLYRLLSHDAITGNSRVELVPVTGRTHQLRLHMAAIGHPIVGDALYGGETTASQRLLLHASMLSFAHPVSAALLNLLSKAPF